MRKYIETKKINLTRCSLNLGELHQLNDFGFFHPVFHCRTEEGDEFVARMRLHITEPLDNLIIVDPRFYPDEGYTANSVNSNILLRNNSFKNKPRDNIILQPALIRGNILYKIEKEQIKQTLLNGYNFEHERDKLTTGRKKPIKIAFTCHNPNIIGGGNLILFSYINWLAEIGVHSAVYSCGRHPTWTRVHAKFKMFSSYKEMFSAIEEDTVILFCMWHIEPMLKAHPIGKLIYNLRQCVDSYHYSIDYFSIFTRKPVIELLESLNFGLITTSPHIMNWYKNELGIESLSITNGVDLCNFYPDKVKGSDPNIKIIISVGDPNYFLKGVDILVKSLTSLAKKRHDLNFKWILVSGQDHRYVPDGLRYLKNLEFISQIGLSKMQMQEFYKKGDVFVNPSLYEGFGLPTLEAMACGIPVVQADNPGLNFIIEDGRDCLIVPRNDSNAMAAAIERLITDKDLSDHLSAQGIVTAGKNSTTHQFDQFVSAFEEILQVPFPSEQVTRIRHRMELPEVNHFISKEALNNIKAATQRTPLISVVIPTYNQADYLREALDSLLSQTYSHWEAIVVNDGSTDNTVEVMDEYAKRDSRIKPFSKPNGGITSALNYGIDHAQGDFFCWLSSDDLFYPNKLELQMKAFENLDDNYALVYGSFDLLQEETKKIEVQPFQEKLMPGAEFAESLKFDFIDGCTIMIKMDVMREIDGFNPYYRHAQDTELWIRIASRGYRFHQVHEKVTVRRIHIAQSSTGNMIHCRYDHAWMINYYLDHFNLLEMYRYFDFTKYDEIERFLNHFVGRMLHTEATINHPLLMEKFWKWFDKGLSALEPTIQKNILKICFVKLIQNRSTTYKMNYYIQACINSLLSKRKYIPFDINFSVEGRDIRHDNREGDEFGQRLFDYATGLLVNAHTPLFAQELYFHNTHKVVDTPYKLSHSALRYLSQFPNRFQKIVTPYSDLSQIPNTQEEATKLFCSLRYPDYASAFNKSLSFDSINSVDLSDIEDPEAEISNLPTNYKNDLRKVCEKNPTETILHYWNALTLAIEGKFEQAVSEGWKTLTIGQKSCDWRIAYRIGQWAEKAKDFEKAWIAYNMGYGTQPAFLPLKEGLERVSRNISVGSHYQPTPKEFILNKDFTDLPDAKLTDCQFIPHLDGCFTLRISCISDTKEIFTVEGRLSYTEPLQAIQITDPFNKKLLKITPNSIFALWSNGYDFIKESQNYFKHLLPNDIKPRVAFTILYSSILGGGPLIVFRYANWLADMGVDVAVYSNDNPPEWMSLKIRFHNISDDAQRYAAITESVVIVYSILEMPPMLRYGNVKNKRIFHICQGVEDFNYHGPDYASLAASKPIFEILHSLPVGRLAVSYHVQNYFDHHYRQRTYTVINGVDLNIFKPRWKRPISNMINIIIVGNPNRLLKGAEDVKQALMILAKKYPMWKLHLSIISNQKIAYDIDTSSLGFTTSLRYELRPEEMRDMYYSADVFINSAWYEGFGLPSLEAMACGLPVVQADNQGLDGIVEDQKNCLIVSPQNPQEIARAIETITMDQNLRERLIKSGIETASRFSQKKQFEMFVEAFENILITKFDSTVVAAKKQELEHGTLNDQIVGEIQRFQPLVSVIVPTYNHARYLPAALDSLIAQTYPNWEALVVNDGSTDNTPKVMEQYAARDHRIRLFHKENGGVASALNEGLRYAKGEWICWLSSDDLFEPDKLQIHINAIHQFPEVKFFHSHYYFLEDESGEKTDPWPDLQNMIPPRELQLVRFFFSNYISGNTIAIHHSVFDQVGYFNEELRWGQDCDMWLRISALFPSIFINKRTCTTRIHSGQATKLSPDAGIFDSARACLEFLNKHPFQYLFPQLDFRQENNIFMALSRIIETISYPESFINRCGYAQALIDRLREWLAHSCPDRLKLLQERRFEELSRHIQNSNLPEEIKAAFYSLRGATVSGFKYKPYDPLKEMARHAERLKRRGKNDEAELIRKYLGRVKQFESKSAGAREEIGQPQNAPLVSVIIPTLNRPVMLREAIKSVLNQTYRNFEIVVINDGGIDVNNIITEMNEEGSITYIKHAKHKGVTAARNTGLRVAQGKYVTYLDDDDIYYPNHLETLVSALENSNYKVAYTDSYHATQELRDGEYVTIKRELVRSNDFNKDLFLVDNLTPIINVMHASDCLADVGLFDEKLKVLEDWELWIRLSRKFDFLHIPVVTAEVHVRSDPSSSDDSHARTKHGNLWQSSRQYIFDKHRVHYAALQEKEKTGQIPQKTTAITPQVPSVEEQTVPRKTERPTFAAVYCIYNDDAWLKDSLDSIYNDVDAIYFLISDRPWYGEASDNRSTLECIQTFPDPYRKIHVINGSWTNETDQRNESLDILSKAGFTYCFVIDADEIYDPVEVRRMMSFAASHPEVACWHMAWDTYWKSYRYRIDPREPFKPVVFVKVGAARFTENRAVGGENHALIPPEVGICHHLSYARSDEEVLKKITTFSHAHEVQPGWYEKVWKRWDVDHSLSNLHPTHPQCYRQAVEQPYSALPPMLKRRYLKEVQTAPALTPCLTSIIILAHNQWDQTELCLNSIARHTPEPHEIIVVDNGSTDETKVRLRALLETHPNLRVIANSTNRGFAAGNNQGISLAMGEYILLLNNDTIVTEGWLSRMLNVFQQYPETGIVGPMSNYVSGPQLVPEAGYKSLEEMHAFAARWTQEHAGQSLLIYRVVGFCLLTKREIIEKIGGLDERFGSGNFEDDDFCIRAALTGYKSRIAKDVFIHHTGSQTFIGAKIDYKKSLFRNWDIFKKKWGMPSDLPYGKGYRLPTMLPSGVSLYVPLPDVSSDHKADAEKQWWEDISKGEYQKQSVQGLTSIIVLTSNNREYTKKCLRSIRKHTPEPHEVIIVPLDSSHAPVKWLKRLVRENSNYKLIESTGKPIYTDACNRGIAESSGQYIVIVNDDVVVTEGWLSGMLECLNSAPDTGIVGPMTSNVEGPQRVAEPDYRSIEHLDKYARSFRERNRYRRVSVKDLSSFCILFRHELTEKVGLFHESFDSSKFAVEDFCLRASLQGYKSVIAGDVFLHNAEESRRDHISKDKQLYVAKWSQIDDLDPIKDQLMIVNTISAAKELSQKGNISNAVALLLEGIKYAPDDRRLHYALAELLIEDKKFKDALEALENMPVGIDSYREGQRQDSRWLELMGYCKDGMELYEEAERYADEVIALNSVSPRAWNLKGIIAFKKGLHTEAEDFFKKAVECDRSFGEAYASLGAIYWSAKRTDDAFDLFEKAAILSPTVEDVVINYHTATVSLSRLGRAEKILKEAIALYPSNRRLNFILIDILLQQKKYGEAMKAMEGAMSTFGIDADILSFAMALREKVGPKEIKLQGSRVQGDKGSSKKDSRGQGVKGSSKKEEKFGHLTTGILEPLNPTISLCMIVKNEEKNMVQCLAGIKPLVDEMIVVDTGSTDRTKEIAKVFGAKVYDFKWTNSFSDARNFSLSKASGRWILVLDADEVISPKDHERVRDLVREKDSRIQGGKDSSVRKEEEHSTTRIQEPSNPELIAYSITTRNYVSQVSTGWVANNGKYKEEAGSGWFPSDKVRLFPNNADIRFENPVHELVEPSLSRLGVEIKKCNVPIHHYGKLDKEKILSKGEDYYNLGRMKLAEKGEKDIKSIYELAIQASELGKHEDALGYFQKVIEARPDSSKALFGIANTYFQLNRYEEALSSIKRALQLDPHSTDTIVLYSSCELCAGDPVASVVYLEEFLRTQQAPPMVFLALATSYFCTGAKEKGVEYVNRLRGMNFICSDYFSDIAKKLISAKRLKYALLLLEGAMESNSINRETPVLLSECYRMIGENRDKDSRDQGIKESSEEIQKGSRGQGVKDSSVRKEEDRLTTRILEPSNPTLSLCMIVKNEEKNLARSLTNIKPFVDEMIVVDTGSTDRTKDIAKALGAKVYDFKWTDSFSDARNFSLSKASGRWILVLDADEVISPSDFDALKALIVQSGISPKRHSRESGNPENNWIPGQARNDTTYESQHNQAVSKPAAYLFVTRNYVIAANTVGWITNDGNYIIEEAGTGWFPGEKVRLFPNDRRVRFESPVHERVEPSLERSRIEIKKCEIPIHHYGVLVEGKTASKGEFYYNLGKIRLAEKGEKDVMAIYDLAVQASGIGRYEEALEYLKKAIAVKPDFSKAFESMGNIYYNLRRYGDALSSYEKAIQLGQASRDTIVMYSNCEIITGNVETSIAQLEALLRKDPTSLLAVVSLAVAYFCGGRKGKGMELVKKLRDMDFIGADNFANFAKILISAKRFNQALLLLEAAIETGNSTPEISALLEECRKLQEGSREQGVEESSEEVQKGSRGQGVKDSSVRKEEDRLTTRILEPSNPRTLSLCMIAKNEEDNIGRCLTSIKPVVDEMIVVDTGSTDRTKDIAKAFGAQVYDFKWTNSFSDARNFSLSKATGKWILVLDADEVISPSDFDALKALIVQSGISPKRHSRESGNPENNWIPGQARNDTTYESQHNQAVSKPVAYSLVTRNYVIPQNIVGWIANDGRYREEAGTGWFPTEKVRLFPNNDHIRFKNLVHELVEFSLIQSGMEIKKCSIPIHHYGTLSIEKLGSKGEEYYNLGKLKLAESGGSDILALFELSVQAGVLGKYEEALEYWQRIIALEPSLSKIGAGLTGLKGDKVKLGKGLSLNTVQLFGQAYYGMGNAYFHLGRYGEALSSLKRAKEIDPDSKDIMLLYTKCELCAGDVEASISCLESLVGNDLEYPRAILLLAAAYFCSGRKEKGKEYLKKLKDMNINGADYFSDIARILISTKRLNCAVVLLEAAIESSNANSETPVLLAECYKMLGESSSTDLIRE